MTSNQYDVVVAGAGHNTLMAAAYLATAGLKVMVLERNRYIGGGVATQEITAPGFKHDLHSTGHYNLQANPVILNDELGLQAKYGLEYIYPDVSIGTVFDDGSKLLTYFDLDKTCESIAAISEKDAISYREHTEKMRKLMPMFLAGMYVPPAPLGSFMGILEQSREGRELIGIMLKSAYDVIDEMFESDKVKIHFMKFSAEAMIAPEEKGTGIVFCMLPGIIHSFHGGFPKGGSGELSESMARCIRDHGGEVLTNKTVTKVIVESGKAVGVELDNGEIYRASRAVIGGFHPAQLDDFVEGVDPDIISDVKRLQPASYSCVVSHYALHEAPVYKDLDPSIKPSLLEFLPSDMETFRREFDELRYGRTDGMESIIVSTHTELDPTRAPEGKHTLYIYQFAPYNLAEGGVDAWDTHKDEVADRMLEELRKHTTNLTDDNIIAKHVSSPKSHLEDSPSFRMGDVLGIGQYIYQFLGRRPTPELAQYAVPGVEGLYLAGPCMHPGGGVIGGGRATAVKMFEDLGLDFDEVVSVNGK